LGLIDTLRFVLRHPLNRGRPANGLLAFLKWQIASRLQPAIVVDFVDDIKLVVGRGMSGATGNIYCGLHEYEDMSFTLHLLRPGDLFVDVGSNIGSYTMLAVAAGADAIAFEPGERFTDLQRNVAINNANVDCHKQAVGAENGSIRFTVGLDCVNRPAVKDDQYVDVPVVRLDDVIERRPTLIKVDVEGYEGSVLSGAMRTFAGAAAVIMELNGQTSRYGQSETEIRKSMIALGFVEAGYDPVARSLTVPTARGNSIFVREGVAHRLKTSRQFKVHGQLV
jgi:FkbM family methyltransferase